jgi:MOSC domain-containing protein YiiM
MRLLHIHTAPKHGAPMLAHDEIEAVAGKGLVGDRDFGKTRQVTIVCTGELAAAAVDLGLPEITPGSTRRNLTIEMASLPRTHETQIRIGEVLFEVRRECTPCLVMNTEVAPGAEQALIDRAGVSAHVLESGIIRVGDPVAVLADSGPDMRK